MTTEHVDVLIVGAGLSGICAAYYLQTRCPAKTYTILESREAIGGTWDLFRYPGIRSDSDMHTLGYSFRPWQEAKTIADGPSILSYLRETAADHSIDRKIRYGHKVKSASWSSSEAAWTVEVELQPGQKIVQFTCNFLFLCTGYYDYTNGFAPTWPGMERFTGRIVHPQHWPEGLDYIGKRVVVIGSGATAVTLVPAMAERAAHVTMLQRSPTYIVSIPAQDTLSAWMRRRLPGRLASRLARWKSILIAMTFYGFTRRLPGAAKRFIVQQAREQLGPQVEIEPHFTPRYNPWDQRLCLAPDGDLFAAVKSGKASVVTGQIETFTETGIRLCSGEELAADIIVSATGLVLKLAGGMRLNVDGVPVDLSKTLSYKGMMYSDIPNLVSVFGYTNASWTLKCELIAQYTCRLLNYMDRKGYDRCTPRRGEQPATEEPVLNLTSGYILRSRDALPHQGSRKPWRMHQNYFQDLFALKLSKLNDGTMEFARKAKTVKI